MVQVLTPAQIQVQHPAVYKIFFEKPDERKRGESLHDYFTRKKMKCFCPKCRKAQAQSEQVTML